MSENAMQTRARGWPEARFAERRVAGLGLALALLLDAVAVGAPPSSAWPLVWGDEFAGVRLEATKWSAGALPWGGRHHNDQYASYITPEDSYVRDGSLWLRCRRATGNEFGGYPYSEGFVHTNGKQNYTYGYVEIRARFPSGRGVWPAFWTLPQGWPPEFDIAEYFGSDDRMHCGLAYGGSWQDVRWDSTNLYGERFGDWHSYGLEWGPGYAVWYKDGLPRKTITASYVPSTPMYILLNSGMRWDADGSTPVPNLFEVDYCRLYGLPGTVVNDGTTGTGWNQFQYVGPWDAHGAQAGAHLSDNHWSSTAQSYFLVRFSGARVDLYGAKAPNHGIGAVSIDGGPEVLIDYYAAARIDKALVWCSPSLGPGAHSLKVRVTGTRNAASTGLAVPADRVDVWAASGRLNGAVIGTTGSWNNSGNTRVRAADGDLHTFFDAPVADGAWVGLDFGAGASKRITKVRYGPRPGFSGRMVGGRFQGANSATFSDAVDLATITSAPPEERLTDQSVNLDTGFRFLRYLAPAGGHGNVAEIEAHGLDAPPARPTGLTADAGDRQVTLTWNEAAGSTAYRVKRGSTPGAGYSLIATLEASRYVDLAVTNDVAYTYVVSAFGVGGESADSAEAVATPRGPPRLLATVESASGGFVLVWPAWATNYVLRTATEVQAPMAWQEVTNTPQSGAGGIRLVWPGTQEAQRYFQLQAVP